MQIRPDQTQPTCDECFFRRAGLCALATATVCPTFRPVDTTVLAASRDEPRRQAVRRVTTAA